VALIPTWLISHWREGVRGLWGMDPPAVVAVHATGATDKLLTLSANGLFDRRAYRAAPESIHAQIFAEGKNVRTVAYLQSLAWPSLDAGATGLQRAALDFDSVDDYRAAAVQGLPAAALLSGRVFGFSHVPCESPWLKHTSAAGGPVWRAPGGDFKKAELPTAGLENAGPAKNWSFLKCRSGLCNEWRVVPVGYTSPTEAALRARLREAARGSGLRRSGAHPIPESQPMACSLHPNMIWPDGPVRWNWGNRCSGHTNYQGPGGHKIAGVGHTLNPWEVRAYAERLGALGTPKIGKNVAFGERVGAWLAATAAEGAEGARLASAGRPPALLQVSEAELRAEMARFEAEPIVWLGWPLNVTSPAEGVGRLADRMRHLCRSDLPRPDTKIPR